MRSRDFAYGVGTSSFQIEGAAGQRLPSIWDTFCEVPGTIDDHSNGLVACDHVSRWREDVELMASLGVDAYRFSVSWPRVIRLDGSPNPQGLQFYLRLLDELLRRNIKPFVTIYHWDLPQFLEDQGGWLNRDTAYRMRDYAEILSRAFGDRVYSYATLNEPYCSAYLGYELGVHAPGVKGRGLSGKASHHLLLAHGLAMDVLRETSPGSLNGIVLNFSPAYPASDDPRDVRAANTADALFNHWYLMPVVEGRYPGVIERLPAQAKPDIREGDLELIAGPVDYIGINYYTRAIYRADETELFVEVHAGGCKRTDMSWEVYPQGLSDLLVALDRKYRLPPIYITENGAAFADVVVNGDVDDGERLEYLDSHLNAVHHAIERGVDVRGYFCWSLMDNFEWARGYTKRFGIVHVDFRTQRRTIKASGRAFRDFLAGRDAGGAS